MKPSLTPKELVQLMAAIPQIASNPPSSAIGEPTRNLRQPK